MVPPTVVQAAQAALLCMPKLCRPALCMELWTICQKKKGKKNAYIYLYIYIYIYIRYIRKPTSWCSKLDFLSEFVSNFWELQQKSSYLWDRKAYKQTIHSNSDLASQCWRIKKIKQHHTLAHSPALLLLYFPPHQKVMQIIRTIHVKLQSTHTEV